MQKVVLFSAELPSIYAHAILKHGLTQSQGLPPPISPYAFVEAVLKVHAARSRPDLPGRSWLCKRPENLSGLVPASATLGLTVPWTPKVCRIIAFYGFWAIILPLGIWGFEIDLGLHLLQARRRPRIATARSPSD